MIVSKSRVLTILNSLSIIAFILCCVMLIATLFSKGPSQSGSIREYTLSNVSFIPNTTKSEIHPLSKWFGNNVFVTEVRKAFVYIRIKNTKQLFTMPVLILEGVRFTFLCLWCIIAFNVMRFFSSLKEDEVFNDKNIKIVRRIGLLIICQGIIGQVLHHAFVNCIRSLDLNDSNYFFNNEIHFMPVEFIVGLCVLGFSIILRYGTSLKKENEAFI